MKHLTVMVAVDEQSVNTKEMFAEGTCLNKLPCNPLSCCQESSLKVKQKGCAVKDTGIHHLGTMNASTVQTFFLLRWQRQQSNHYGLLLYA